MRGVWGSAHGGCLGLPAGFGGVWREVLGGVGRCCLELAKKTRGRDKKRVVLALFLAWSRAVMLTPFFVPSFLSVAMLATPASATAPQDQSSDEATPVQAATATVDRETNSRETNSEPRAVLGQRVERLSVEPQALPLTICFHAAAGDRSHCVEALGGRDLECPIAPDSLVELWLPSLADVRVRLLDESHRLVPSDDRLSSDGVGQSRYLIQPESPLVPGTKHFVRVDGLVDDLPTAIDGAQYRPVRVSFVTSGEKPSKAVQGKKKKKKRGRRR